MIEFGDILIAKMKESVHKVTPLCQKCLAREHAGQCKEENLKLAEQIKSKEG